MKNTINDISDATLMFSIAYNPVADKWLLAGYTPKENDETGELEYTVIGEGNYEGLVKYLDEAYASKFFHFLVQDLQRKAGTLVERDGERSDG